MSAAKAAVRRIDAAPLGRGISVIGSAVRGEKGLGPGLGEDIEDLPLITAGCAGH